MQSVRQRAALACLRRERARIRASEGEPFAFLCNWRACAAIVKQYKDDDRHNEMLRKYAWDETREEWVVRKNIMDV